MRFLCCTEYDNKGVEDKMKLQCVYKCRNCGLKFLDMFDTNEPLEAILMHLSSYNFMFKEHKCINGTYGTCNKIENINGIADLIGFKVAEEEDAESIHPNNES